VTEHDSGSDQDHDNSLMSDAADPYAVLGVPRDISDVELRRVYRELVKRHHPDHNGGSAQSAARFAQIQQAYALIAGARRPEHGQPGQPARQTSRPASTDRPAARDPLVEQRLREMEQQLERRRAQAREAELRAARERAEQAAARQRAAYEAIAARERRGPTQEELGYYSTQDSLSKIVDDAADQFGKRVRDSDSRRQFARRLSDLFGRRD
jgi:curved DNA-binding protein CbpA